MIPFILSPLAENVMRMGIEMMPNKMPNPCVMLLTNSCFNRISGVRVCIRRDFPSVPTKNGGFAKSKIVAKTDSAAVGSRVFSFLFENVHEHGNENDDRKNDSGSPIDHRGIDVLPAYPVSIVFNE